MANMRIRRKHKVFWKIAICSETPRKGVLMGWRQRLKREKDRLRKAMETFKQFRCANLLLRILRVYCCTRERSHQFRHVFRCRGVCRRVKCTDCETCRCDNAAQDVSDCFLLHCIFIGMRKNAIWCSKIDLRGQDEMRPPCGGWVLSRPRRHNALGDIITNTPLYAHKYPHLVYTNTPLCAYIPMGEARHPLGATAFLFGKCAVGLFRLGKKGACFA